MIRKRIVGPSILTDSLVGISLLPLNANADEGSADVLGPFDEIAGEDAQSSRIHFKIGMKTELHAEISNGRELPFAHGNTSFAMQTSCCTESDLRY